MQVLVTVGRGVGADELGPQPDHVFVTDHLPQSRVLPYCDVVVCHAGSGSVAGALARGLPLVCLPMGADQPHNAARCEDLGLGRVLDSVTATPAAVREAVAEVLSDPRPRQAAQRLRAEWAALPGPASALTLLEQLAAA